MKRKYLVILFLLVLMRPQYFPVSPQNQSRQVTDKEIKHSISFIPEQTELVKTKSYTPHSPIEILSNDYFLNYSFTGTGAIHNPYLITKYNITTSSEIGILIQDTTKSFVIRDCFINASKHGIRISNVASGTALLENNECAYHIYNGITIGESSETIVQNNTVHDNRHTGISIVNSGLCIISENKCYKNRWGGIYFDDGHYSEIINNTIWNNNYYAGISIFDSFNLIIRNNTCINNEVGGIRCSDAVGILIEHNVLFNDNGWGGISISHCDSFVIQNNTVTSDRNALSVYRSFSVTIRFNDFYNAGLYIHQDDLLDYYYLDIENNYVNGLKLGFFINKDKITLEESTFGQLIFIDCRNIKVENQGQQKGFLGITIRKCTSVVIKDSKTNNFDNNAAWGVRVFDSDDVEIINCIFNYGRGIYLENTINSIIKSNLCRNNTYGISLQNLDYCEVVNNTCMYGTFGGMILEKSDNCEIMYNLIYKNGILTEFDRYGLEIYGKFNVLHHNIFIENDFNGTLNAIDYGTSNIWFDEKCLKGNFWDNYDGEGAYEIFGSANSTDPYPLLEIPVYIEPNYFAYYFSAILIVPLVTFTMIKLISKKKK